jgi:hypothetical protein
VRLLNVDVDDLTMDELLAGFKEGMLLTLHVDMIMKLQHDEEFYELLPEFDVVTCDSQILYFASKVLGTPLRARVSGSDYWPLFCEKFRRTRRSRSSSAAAPRASPRWRCRTPTRGWGGGWWWAWTRRPRTTRRGRARSTR